MKRTFTIIAFISVMATVIVACNSSSGMKVSPAELAQYNTWKAENEKAEVKKAVAKKAVTYQSPKMISETQNQAKVAEKKGWSKAAKATVIGAGSGAVLGAVINKRNRAAGAVIGGVIGGGVGYGIGRKMDKNDGRS